MFCLLLLLPNVMEHRSLLIVYVFNFYQTLRVVPHGTKGTGPGFITRPVYLRSQFRNNTNTVSTLVLLVHLLQIHYRFSVHGTRVSHITGRSRPPGEVGLTPRQYTEWNVAGACSLYWRSLSQQGLLPEVYRTASTGRCAQATSYQQRNNHNHNNPRYCALVLFIAGDALHHQPMGAGHMSVLQLRGPMESRVLSWWLFIAGNSLCHQPMRTDHMSVLQLHGPMAFRVLQWCHPMLARTRGASCCARIITLYGTRKWIQAHT